MLITDMLMMLMLIADNADDSDDADDADAACWYADIAKIPGQLVVGQVVV